MKRWLPWILVIVLAAYGGWQWWVASGTSVSVTGEATVKAAPDEYLFYPSYQEKSEKKDEARTKVTEVGNGVVTKLKELGVTESRLASNVTVNEEFDYGIEPVASPTTKGFVGTYSITITLEDFELAKKVQEYLGTTPVVGSVTPTSTFQDATQKQLEREARKLALEDAKLQAKDTADTLELTIVKIESIGEPIWGGPVPFYATAEDATVMKSLEATASPELLVGEQEVTYSIQVTYRLR